MVIELNLIPWLHQFSHFEKEENLKRTTKEINLEKTQKKDGRKQCRHRIEEESKDTIQRIDKKYVRMEKERERNVNEKVTKTIKHRQIKNKQTRTI